MSSKSEQSQAVFHNFVNSFIFSFFSLMPLQFFFHPFIESPTRPLCTTFFGNLISSPVLKTSSPSLHQMPISTVVPLSRKTTLFTSDLQQPSIFKLFSFFSVNLPCTKVTSLSLHVYCLGESRKTLVRLRLLVTK